MKNKIVNSSCKISIIVPVYNASEKLHILMKSLLNQTYNNYEIIMIDDGSSDDSLKIMNEYQKKYSKKIKVYSRKNKGVAYTRNEGIKYVTGDYFTYCDNDDEVADDYLETFVRCLRENDYDIIVGGYKRMDYSGKVLFIRKLENKPLSLYIQLACWGKLYKTSFVKENKFKFLDSKIADEFYFNVLAYQKTNNFKILEATKYHWLYNQESLSNTENKKLNYTDDLLCSLDKTNKDLNTINDKELLDYFYLRTVIYYLLFSCKGVSYKKISDCYDKMFQWLGKNTNLKKKNKYIGITKREGEQFSIKIVISSFLILRKLRLIKIFIYLYSKI